MSARRLLAVFALDWRHFWVRPLCWVWIGILGLTAWGLTTGDMRIASGDATVGGTKAWLTSEFSISMMLSMVIFIFYLFFIAINAGMLLIRDDEHKVGEVLHSTPLTAREYVWGKFLAALACFAAVLAVHIAFTMFFNHIMPNKAADEIRGPFDLMNYLRPALLFGVPTITFLAGTTFAIGSWSRKPILIFVLPLALLFLVTFFLWDWSPVWLDPRLNRALMLVEPSGFRWLSETFLKVDRGVDYYNTARLVPDLPFVLSRLVLTGLGLMSVFAVQGMLGRRLRGTDARVTGSPASAAVSEVRSEVQAPLGGLGMTSGPVGFLRGSLAVARFELAEMRGSAGLYLFIPIILIQIIAAAVLIDGPLGTRLLFTSGMMAAATANTISLLVCLLLLFYTVESLEREPASKVSSILYATRTPTGSLLFGKALANGFLGAVVMLLAFVGCVIALLIQGRTPIEVTPFVLVWGALLLPTFLGWTSFVVALRAFTGNRYTSYAVALGVLILTGYLQSTGRMSWTGNWMAWSVARWSDFGIFEVDRLPLLANRLMLLSLVPFFIALTARFFARKERDATRTVHRLRPATFLRGALGLAPFLVLPLAAGITQVVLVERGYQGKQAERKDLDYWRAGVSTWKDAPMPRILDMDLDLEIFPPENRLTSTGSLLLTNATAKPMQRFVMTAASNWKEIDFTVEGQPFETDRKSWLHVFNLEQPLEPGARLRVGWTGTSLVPPGASKNSGNLEEFITPMGTVLTGFSGAFAPVMGYQEGIGVTDKNRAEPREYADDFYLGDTPGAFGNDMPFTLRTRVTAPERYTINGVGTLAENTVAAGKRTVVWETDHPIYLPNVVLGEWAVRRGEGTALYHHPKHTYNIDEMIEALDASRRYYSEWFYEFPWQELKVSEFPSLAMYAQGFPTNITFSEGIGFLTKSDPQSNAAFFVTAHEAAHQWWGNILHPGKGPGGNILSEGMAHFSTTLLFEQVKGPEYRIEFLKGIEDRYGERRQADSERPMVKIDGERPGDTTVMYDKGGWVFWMLLNLMGREPALAGYSDFIHRYAPGPDHPVLQDFLAVMREHAPDLAAYDAFVEDWFYEVHVSEFRFHETRREEQPDGTWVVTGELENKGTADMAVEVAAQRGERFPKPEKDAEGLAPVAAAEASGSAYQEARIRVRPGAEGKVPIRLECAFKPDRVVVDPDAMVLQLNRPQAIVRF